MSDVVIEINGITADLYSDTAVTLNYKGNILGSISDITCNSSQTIRLPKTSVNDMIFGLALMPDSESEASHALLPCRCYADGFMIVDNGVCHLLGSSGSEYEIAVTWGILHDYAKWLADKPKLRDLKDSEDDSISWNAYSAVSVWDGGVSAVRYKGDIYPWQSSSLHYGEYSCGVNLDDRIKCNLSPFVTLREIWQRVTDENSINIEIDDIILDDMERTAIVLTKNNNTSLQTISSALTVRNKAAKVSFAERNDRYKKLCLYIANADDFFDNEKSSVLHYGSRTVSLYIDKIGIAFMRGHLGSGSDTFLSEQFPLVIRNLITGEEYSYNGLGYSDHREYSIDRTFTATLSEEDNGKPVFEIYVRLHRWDGLPLEVWENPNSPRYIIGQTGGWYSYSLADSILFNASPAGTSQPYMFTYTYQNNNNSYPLDDFRLVPNLPDITQIDFIKFICNYYGLMAMQADKGIRLVSVDSVRDKIDEGVFVDWSEWLVDRIPSCPMSIDFSVEGYAQRNAVAYKLDSNDPYDVTAYIRVDNSSIEAERNLIEFPFAATRYRTIPQYSFDEDGVLQYNECEYRLMNVVFNPTPPYTLSFDSIMRPLNIINRRYSFMQDILRKPIIIEEDITLPVYVVMNLDFTTPVYLSKYGRYFAIISIQWQSDQQTCKIKLLRIK
jgi:hypothetical protein